MSRQKLVQQAVAVTLVALFLVGCATPAATTLSETPAPTATPEPPAVTPTPEPLTPISLTPAPACEVKCDVDQEVRHRHNKCEI